MRLLVVNLGEDPAQAADVDRLARDVPGAHHQRQFGEDFLGAAQGEGGHQDAAAAGQNPLNGGGQALDFLFAGESRRSERGCRGWFP